MNQRILFIALIAGISLTAGWWGRGLAPMQHTTQPNQEDITSDGPCPGGADPIYWKAPMDPTYMRDAPGKSPMGMDLVPECPEELKTAPEGAVLIDAATIQNIGVRTAQVVRRDLSRSVRAVGRVAFDERRVTHVHTKVQGWIENLFVDFVGQEIKQGQPLLEIYSPELVATQEELLLASRYRDSTKESPFEEIRSGGDSLFESTKRRLALWDIADHDVKRLLATGDVKRTLTLYAPTSGYITQLGVRSGMQVQPNENLYTITDLSRVWVLADVYEFEIPWIKLGQVAEVELNYLPGLLFKGELTYIAPFLNPKTRTAQVRLELENPDGKLKPEMFGSATIAGVTHPNVLAIPSEAVIRSGTRTIAVVALGSGLFQPREIELGLDSGDGWLEVESGLTQGEEIVVGGQFLIDSESNLQEAVRKFRSAGKGDPLQEEINHAGQNFSMKQESPTDAPTLHNVHSTKNDHSIHRKKLSPPDSHDHSQPGME